MTEAQKFSTYDFLVIGSGFGGSISAMRLAQKGYRVAVLEKGKRWRRTDFPKSNMHLSRFLWMPLFRFFGPQQITFLPSVMVLHGSGVGGGSLIYANTLMKPPASVFKEGDWPKEVQDWDQELEPYYSVAKKMLGVTPNPRLFEAEEALYKVGEKLGVAHTFHPTEVGVFFGKSNEAVSDPYFSGAGPDRVGCNHCGGCMVGCRYGAKNTLDQNYLYFAEKWGVQVFPETQADRIVPIFQSQENEGEARYRVDTYSSTGWWKSKRTSFYAKNVVLSAGVMGTMELLLKNKLEYGTLRNVSDTLGQQVRTNGESLLGATSFEDHRVLSRGIAIGAAIHPDFHTKIEAVKYPEGSGTMGWLGVPLTPNGSRWSRPLKLVIEIFKNIPQLFRLYRVRDWARSSVILLVMQSIDSKMKLVWGRGLRTGFRKGLTGVSVTSTVPAYLQVAQDAAEILANEIGGYPQNVISEVLFNTPATAHILGGCVMASDSTQGVVSEKHEVFNYPGLFVADGSVIPCNLGVNPSLTISALAERFASRFPVASDAVILSSREIQFSESTS